MMTDSRRSQPRPVLLVDDHEDTRSFIEMLLHLEGFTVVTASNGQQALERLRATRPCLILLDLTMPVMDGWEFRAVQRQLSDRQLADTPVVLLSAMRDLDLAREKMSAVDYIPKPIDPAALLVKVRRYC